MWTKISNNRGAGGREKRTTPAIMRPRSGSRQPRLVLPASFVTAERVDIYTDGNGKMAFRQHKSGAFKVCRAAKSGHISTVGIPPQYADGIPYGTTDVTLMLDGDMLVLDKAQLAPAMAAE